MTNQKGGVGKSTLAVHLVTWLRENEVEAALVDADVQSSSSVWVKEVDEETPVYRFQTADEVLEQVPEIDEEVIVIDGPGGLGETTRAVMLVSDLSLIPCGPSVLDLRAANNAVRALHQAQKIREGKPGGVFVPNKVQKNYRLSRQLIDTAQEFGLNVGPALGLRQAYADAVGQRTVVWRMGAAGKQAANEITALFEKLFTNEESNEESREKAAVNE